MTSARQKARRTRNDYRARPTAPRRGRPPIDGLRQRREDEILAKATRVFAQLGYRNTDVEQIAEPLGIAKGTVYRYFETKEQLFIACVERGMTRLDETIDRAVESTDDGIQRMVVAIRAYLEFFDKHPALVELFIQECAEFREQRMPTYFRHGCANEERWRQSLRSLIAQGRLREVPVERIKTVIGDLVYGTMFTNHLKGRREPFEKQAADIVDVVFNGILSDTERGVH